MWPIFIIILFIDEVIFKLFQFLVIYLYKLIKMTIERII